MNPFQKMFGRFSIRGKAMSSYKRGMGRARRRDHQGAIGDYTRTIEMADVPQDIKAMALYNRALMHVASGNAAEGTKDLNGVLAINTGHVNIKTMAKQMLFRMDARTQRDAGGQTAAS